jgi:hypothetical protein
MKLTRDTHFNDRLPIILPREFYDTRPNLKRAHAQSLPRRLGPSRGKIKEGASAFAQRPSLARVSKYSSVAANDERRFIPFPDRFQPHDIRRCPVEPFQQRADFVLIIRNNAFNR